MFKKHWWSAQAILPRSVPAFLLAVHYNYSAPEHSTQGIPNTHVIPESAAYLGIP